MTYHDTLLQVVEDRDADRHSLTPDHRVGQVEGGKEWLEDLEGHWWGDAEAGATVAAEAAAHPSGDCMWHFLFQGHFS